MSADILTDEKTKKAALDNPELPVEFIRDLLAAKVQKSEPFEFEE